MNILNEIDYKDLIKQAAGVYTTYKQQEQALELQKQQLEIAKEITRQKQLEQQAAIQRLQYQRAIQYATQQRPSTVTGTVEQSDLGKYLPWIVGGGLVLLFISQT